MWTAQDVIDAGMWLSLRKQKDVIRRLRKELVNKGIPIAEFDNERLPDNFAERLTDAFNEMKQRAISANSVNRHQ